MRSEKPFNTRERLRSFRFAATGIRYALRVTHNLYIHLFFCILVIGLASWLSVSRVEWALLIGCMGLVLSLELLNTAIEVWIDWQHPERDPRAGRIKDLAAGSVLIAALFSAVVGLLILLPPLLSCILV